MMMVMMMMMIIIIIIIIIIIMVVVVVVVAGQPGRAQLRRLQHHTGGGLPQGDLAAARPDVFLCDR